MSFRSNSFCIIDIILFIVSFFPKKSISPGCFFELITFPLCMSSIERHLTLYLTCPQSPDQLLLFLSLVFC